MLLVSPQVRAGLKQMTASHLPRLVVLSYNEITRDTLVMRVAGYPEAISRNYKVVSTTGHCHGLEMNGAPGVHEYCIENGRLTVEDPSARFAVVYRKASR